MHLPAEGYFLLLFFKGEKFMATINKECKTINERIGILQSRGLLFKNINKAKEILLEHPYFDIINANEKLFCKPNTSSKEYFSHIFFEDLYGVYSFNNELSKLTMNSLLSAESKLKNSLAYRFSGRYCYNISRTEEYLNPNNYIQPTQRALYYKFSDFTPFTDNDYVQKLKRQNNYMAAYDKLPFWIALKGIVLGTTILFIQFLDPITKNEVKKDLKMDKFSDDGFEFGIYILKEIRNSCAHGAMIYRFSKSHRISTVNVQAGINEFHLSQSAINYMDTLKVLSFFSTDREIRTIKMSIFKFYLKYTVRGKRWMAKKILGKMGNQHITKWLKI